MRVSIPFTYFNDVPKVVGPPNNQQEKQIDAPLNLNKAIINEPVVDVPQEIALRKSQRHKRYAISYDYLVYYISQKITLDLIMIRFHFHKLLKAIILKDG